MEISIQSRGPVGVFLVDGPIRDGEHMNLRHALLESIDQGRNWLVVDLSRGDLLDSAAIGELVACLKRAREFGGDLKLVVRPDGIVHSLLQLMHLDRVFQIFGDEKEAYAAFANEPS